MTYAYLSKLPRLVLLVAAAPAAFAQTPGVGIGTTAPDVSAALDVVSSSKGAQAESGGRYEWNALSVQRGGTAGAGQVGVIAQELEQLHPELVLTDAAGYKSVNYAQLTPVLLEALKELATRNAAFEIKAATLEAKAAQAALLTLQAQVARLLEGAAAPAGAQARK